MTNAAIIYLCEQITPYITRYNFWTTKFDTIQTNNALTQLEYFLLKVIENTKEFKKYSIEYNEAFLYPVIVSTHIYTNDSITYKIY